MSMSFWTIFLIIISWVFVGFLSFIGACIIDMRGMKYDENYFNDDVIVVFLICLFFGYISPLMMFLSMLPWEKIASKLYKWMYKIANGK